MAAWTDPLTPTPDPATLHARMAAWRKAHPRATFAEMEVEASRQVAALRAELIAVAIAAGEPETAPECPTCGTGMQRVGERTRTVTTSGAEPVLVSGGRYRCARPAGPSFSPLADALDLGPSPYSPWLVESAVLVGTTTTFRTAARLLTRFTGVTMHAATVRRVTEAAGATLHQMERAFAATVRETGTVPVSPPNVPLQLSIDGSLVHLRDEGWREVKLLAVGERALDGTAPLTSLSYTATLGSAAQFGDDALGELGRRGIPQATDVVSVNDGAVWIQEILDLHCPQAHRVLDFAHAAEYLADVAKATWPDATAVATWFTAQRQDLLTGDPDRVLAALEHLPASEMRDTAVGYLTSRREQIAYADFTARGWPIGSGCVESAHQHVVQDRLKGRGMRWSRSGAEALVAARVVDANDRWDEVWGQVGPTQRQGRRAHTAERRAARAQVPPRPKQVIDGTPVASHPWRRFRLPGSPRP